MARAYLFRALRCSTAPHSLPEAVIQESATRETAIQPGVPGAARCGAAITPNGRAFSGAVRAVRCGAVVLAALTALTTLAQNPAPQPPPAPASPNQSQALVQPPTPRPYVVVLDPAHGGTNTGARLERDLLEKTVTLSLAHRLAAALRAHGISVVMTRDRDVDVPDLQRAEIANHARADACLTLHATATGSGVHLFTSSLSPTGSSEFLPWQTAQSAWVTRSLRMEAEIDTAFSHTSIHATMGQAAIEPLDHLTCPAVAVELAPEEAAPGVRGYAISDPAYQKSVVQVLTDAIQSWRRDWTRP